MPASDHKAKNALAPGLYIVATPIGNLGDVTLRALDVLRQAEIVACEDTRVTAKLLAANGIRAKTVSYNDHNGQQRRPELLAWLREGKRLALVSDAGTPLISDPGYKLVEEALEQGSVVVPIPGASSVMAALVAAGLPTDRFYFAGFLPAKERARHLAARELAAIPGTLVLLESPRRLADSLTELHLTLGERMAAVCRELTKRYEEVRRGSLGELAQHYVQADTPKGEIVLVIGPAQAPAAHDEEEVAVLLEDALRSHSVKEAAAIVAGATGLPKKELYERALKLKEE